MNRCSMVLFVLRLQWLPTDPKLLTLIRKRMKLCLVLWVVVLVLVLCSMCLILVGNVRTMKCWPCRLASGLVRSVLRRLIPCCVSLADSVCSLIA